MPTAMTAVEPAPLDAANGPRTMLITTISKLHTILLATHYSLTGTVITITTTTMRKSSSHPPPAPRTRHSRTRRRRCPRRREGLPETYTLLILTTPLLGRHQGTTHKP